MTRSDTLAAAATVVVVDTEFLVLAEVEHSLLALDRWGLPDDVTVCTHEVRAGVPHYAVSLSFRAAPQAELIDALERHFRASSGLRPAADLPNLALTAGDELAASQTASRDGGRAVRFPGCQHLTGTLSVREALAVSAIERIHQLGGGDVDDSAELRTRDFVRPRWQRGELVLAVLPAAGGGVAPFEVPNPTPCCAEHR